MNELLDERNIELWNDINRSFIVSIEDSKNSEYGCYHKDGNVIFYVDKENLSVDYFSHELLHAYLILKKVYVGSRLKIKLSQSKILSKVFSYQLLEHIGNCLDHTKMLPMYLEMGFDRRKFLSDYNEYKFSENELLKFKKHYTSNGKLNLEAVDAYIGRVVSILADPNDQYDYQEPLSKLSQIDSYLFSVLNKLFLSWFKFDIDKQDILDLQYSEIVDEFYEGLKCWINVNRNKF